MLIKVRYDKAEIIETTPYLLRQLGYKCYAIGYRFIDWIRLIPVRSLRIVRQLLLPFGWRRWTPLPSSRWPVYDGFIGRWLNWWLVLTIYIFELFGIGELYETLSDFLKFNTRPLTKPEIAIAQSVYGQQLNYKRIRLDTRAFLGPRQQKICYVSFYLINSWGEMSAPLLIHELIHIWQYEKMGAVYMPRALHAQTSEAGYDYGGVIGLQNAISVGAELRDFNLEQQGDIAADYYRIKNGQSPEWGNGGSAALPLYKQVMKAITK